MKWTQIGLFAVVALNLPVYAAKVKGSRIGANEKSAGFFVEAFATKGRVLYRSVKLDANGKFEIDLPSDEPLVYWIDNFPIYIRPNDNITLVLPEKKNPVFILGGSTPVPATAVAETKKSIANIQLSGNAVFNNLLINDVNAAWASFATAKNGNQTVAEIDAEYARGLEMIKKTKDAGLKSYAHYYNELRYLEAKLQWIRMHPDLKPAKAYYSVLGQISLNHPALSSLKSIGLRSLVNNYYVFLRLSTGDLISDQNLSDNGSMAKMEYLLKEVHNERVINEELNQSISYHLSIKGWNPQLDKIMVAAIEKTTDAVAKKNLLEWRDKYAKVSKNAMAPAFSIPDAGGKMVNLSDFKGKVVAIDVWATWCIPCMHSLPYFLKLRDQYKDNPDIVFVSISTDNAKSTDKWLDFLKSKGMNGIELHAGAEQSSAFERDYNISGIPRYILIDQQGKIIEDHAPQASEPEYVQLIEKALKSN